MNGVLLLMGIVILICIVAYRFTEKLPIPSLLIFILLGIIFGENGIFRIHFDNYRAAEIVCSIALVFIMYYGGFGTNVKAARSVAVKSVVLSTLGVVLTAAFTGVFAHYALHLGWLESALIGSVIASTDAASVFNILRTRNLNLKDNTASLLELESGSNDPMSYMLTVVVVSIMNGSNVSVPLMLFQQLFFGILFGLLIGKAAVWALNHRDFSIAQGNTIFVFSVAIIAYALPILMGGNGYLSVYLCGILMGNSQIPEKRDLVRFFDVLTGIAQMMIFFLLGLLVTPVNLPHVIVPALLIALFLTFVGRPLVVAGILAPFRSSLAQIGIVSWAGLRGVASIVFAIYAVLNYNNFTYNLFDLVFCIVLFSMALQGTLLPAMSKWMNMIDENADVRRTFNDYQEENDVSFIKIHMDERHPWAHQKLRNIITPPDFLIALIARQGEGFIVPGGDTEILPGDLLVIAGREFENRENLTLKEVTVSPKNRFCNKHLREVDLPANSLIVMVQRQKETIIPCGDTLILEDDTLVVAHY
ncbi:MAG: potassium/proton antiporter [Candidatus Fournierella pullistercoris]|uniref:Potassium/proton antiporter n=1 Tax=Candidatus Allofournierella pullistercoris TaxID=2838597 RepID=A0A948T1S6_9FIRM|nr:potassium/proton antiporter [Candidatus Fournierella pullistercoris]